MIWGYHYFRKHPYSFDDDVSKYVATKDNIQNTWVWVGRGPQPTSTVLISKGRLLLSSHPNEYRPLGGVSSWKSEALFFGGMAFLGVHPWKLTWNVKWTPGRWDSFLENIVFRFHVSFRGSTLSFPSYDIWCPHVLKDLSQNKSIHHGMVFFVGVLGSPYERDYLGVPWSKPTKTDNSSRKIGRASKGS